MPYDSTRDLPPAVKKRYGPKGQRAFVKAFNRAVYDQQLSEQSGFKIAHSAAQRAEGKMGRDFRGIDRKTGKKDRGPFSTGKKKKGKPSKGKKKVKPVAPKRSPIVEAMSRGGGGFGGGDSDY